MKLKQSPMPGYLIVKALTKNEKTKSGIYLPDNDKEVIKGRGKVVEIGDTLEDGKNPHVYLEIGDMVMFNDLAGTKYQINGEQFRVLRFNEILVKFTKEENKNEN